MTPDELYLEGCRHRSEQLANTPYTGLHSVDIENDIFENYFLPAAEQGSTMAIPKVVERLLSKGENVKALEWIMKYKKATNCSKMKLMVVFGPSVISRLF